jgi:hypothetical protein
VPRRAARRPPPLAPAPPAHTPAPRPPPRSKLARKQRWKVAKSSLKSATTLYAVNSTYAERVTDKEDVSARAPPGPLA